MTINSDDIEALLRYLERRKGIGDTLGCGCTRRVQCGYHREQDARAAALDAEVASRIEAGEGSTP